MRPKELESEQFAPSSFLFDKQVHKSFSLIFFQILSILLSESGEQGEWPNFFLIFSRFFAFSFLVFSLINYLSILSFTLNAT